MGAAFGWGAVAASSLVLGMSLGLLRPWPNRLIGLVLAFGAGALVSAVSFELFEEGVQVGGAAAVGIGLGVGAVVYFVLARAVEKLGPGGGSGGTALALGAFLDGIPEQMVLGIGIAASAHLAAITPHCPYIEFLPANLCDSLLRKELVADELKIVNGQIPLPRKPGLGIEVNMQALRKFEVDA